MEVIILVGVKDSEHYIGTCIKNCMHIIWLK